MEDDIFVRVDHEGNITGFHTQRNENNEKNKRGKALSENNLFPNAAINIITF